MMTNVERGLLVGSFAIVICAVWFAFFGETLAEKCAQEHNVYKCERVVTYVPVEEKG